MNISLQTIDPALKPKMENIPKLPDPVKYVLEKKDADLTDNEFRKILTQD